MPSPVAETLAATAAVLDRLGLQWYVFGAQAALLRGSRRMTEDLDITLFLDRRSPQAVVDGMQQGGFSLRVPDIDDFVAKTRVLPFVYEATRMPVDLVIGGPGLEEIFLAACEPLVVGDASVLVPSAEHLILMKLLAARPHDLLDAAAIARANDVDFEAVEALASVIADAIGEHDILTHLAQLRRMT